MARPRKIKPATSNETAEQTEKEENLVKKTCRELGITQKELAERLQISQSTVMRWGQQELDQLTKSLMEGLIYKQRFQNIKKMLQSVI